MTTATTTLSRRASLAVPARLPVSHLSHSSLALFWRCPERWRRRYVLGERESVGGAAVIGKAVGAALTARFAAQIAGDSLSLADIDDLYLAEFDDAAPAAFFKDKEPPAVLRRQGRQVLVAYLARIAPTLRPTSVERKVELRFDGAQWSFVGYLDVEDASGEVIDLKVKAKHLGQAEADHSAQASAYLLARSLEGRPARRFAFHSLRRGAKRADIQVVQTERSAGQLEAFERRLALTARAITRCVETGDWAYAAQEGWWCSAGPSGCPHFVACPGGVGEAPAELAGVVSLPSAARQGWRWAA